jgi:hypothetical protein
MTASTSTWLVDPVRELTPDAKCRAGSHGLDVFDEYAPPRESSGDDEESTRLAIRFEATPSRWRTTRWWASLLIVIGAAAAGGTLMGSRRSSARHHLQRLEPSTTIVGRLPWVEPQARDRGPRPTRVHDARERRSRHRDIRRLRHRTVLTRRRAVPRVPVAAPPVETPPAHGAERPEPRRKAPVGQFSYLGQ